MISRDTFAASGAEIISNSAVFPSIREAAVDSRAVKPGDLFVPLKGENTDGHLFIESALKQGAAAVLVSKEFYSGDPKINEIISKNDAAIFAVVPDTLEALQNMARFAMGQTGKSLIKLGVTGSNGKTTTKELIGAVIQGKGNTFINKGNLNSEIGLCQEVLRLEGDVDYAVFEMGMNRKGEMDILADIVRPDLAVITNIGTAHIGLIGSTRGIAEEKKKIFSHFSGSETGFVFEDEPFFEYLKKDVNGRILPYGRKTAGANIIEKDKALQGSEIFFPEGSIQFPLIGKYNRHNMYAAYMIGKHLGVPFGEMKDALESVTPLFGRGQIIEGETTVILDCYNANFDSMREALTLIAELPRKGKKAAVLGDMAELGDFSDTLHRELGAFVSALPLDAVFYYGPRMRSAFEAGGSMDHLFHSENIDELAQQIEAFLTPGDLLLLKGSRSMELERIYQYLSAGKKEKTLC